MIAAFPKQNLLPFQTKNRPVFCLNFYDVKGKRQNKSLGTRDQTEAKTIALELETILNDPVLRTLKNGDPSLEPFHPTAQRLLLGEKYVRKKSTIRPPLKTVVEARLDFMHARREIARGKPISEIKTPPPNEIEVPELTDAISRIAILEKALKASEAKAESSEKERLEYRQRLNLHCKVTLREALESFEAHYRNGHTLHTVRQVLRVNRSCATKVGIDKLLGEVIGAEISEFVQSYRDKKGKAVGPKSQRKMLRYISVFWSWAVVQHQLSMNPIQHTHAIAGANVQKEIVAFKSYKEVQAVLKALKPFPYWHAWVAVAIFVGPRWSEQCRMKLSDVKDDFSTITIAASKTGRIRQTPIEQDVLKPILKAYLKNHPDKSASSDQKSGLLFPSVVAGHGKKSHQWTSTTWHKHFFGGWNPIKDKNGKLVAEGTRVEGVITKASKGDEAPYLHFGPDEWRHCAGTAMGHTGLSSLQISQYLGNSEKIAREFYLSLIHI